MLLNDTSTETLLCHEQEEKYETINEIWMTRKEAADYLRVSVGSLAVWDCTGRYDLKPFRLGARLIRYRKSILDQFLMNRLTVVRKRRSKPTQ